MKKLVPARLSRRHHDRGDEQSRECEEAENRRGEDAPYRQRHTHQRHAAATRLEHRRHVVETAHREGDDEDRERCEHADDAPARARRSRQNRLRRIERPAGAGRAAGHEHAGDQHEYCEQIHPEAQHVHVREHHVPRPAHEWNEQVAEAAEEEGGEEVDHHDHPVHGDELVITLRLDDREGVRKAKLQSHHHRHRHRDQPDRHCDDRVLDRNDLVILAPDVFANESLRIVQLVLVVPIGDCDKRHLHPPDELLGG